MLTRGNTVVEGRTLSGFANGKFLFVSNFGTCADNESGQTTRFANICRAVSCEVDTDIMPPTIASKFYDLICWVAVKNVRPKTKAFFVDKGNKIKCRLLTVADYNNDTSHVLIVYRNRKRIKTVRAGTKHVIVKSFLTTKTVKQFFKMEFVK